MNIAQKVHRRVFRTIVARLEAIETEDDLVAAINGLEQVAGMLLIHGREG